MVRRKAWTNEEEYNFWEERDLGADYQDYLDAFCYADYDYNDLNSAWNDSLDH